MGIKLGRLLTQTWNRETMRNMEILKRNELFHVKNERMKLSSMCEFVRVCACVCKLFALHIDLHVERTLHSHMVQESFFHRSPSVRSRPSISVQSVLLRRASSLLICKDTRDTAHLLRGALVSAPPPQVSSCFHTEIPLCCL